MSFNGILDIVAKNSKNEKIVFHNKFKIHLKPNGSQSCPISLSITTDITNVYIQYTDDTSNLIAKDSIKVPFVLIKDFKK